jgi:flagellar assembly protein FliH
MGLIKSDAAPASVTPFSLADVEKVAKALLINARQQAEALLARARREAEEIKTRAHAQGLEEGLLEGVTKGTEEGRLSGHQQALAEHRDKFAEAVGALSSAMVELNASRADLDSAALQEVVELSLSVARRVTKRQGALDPAVVAENLREAMKLVVHAGDVKVAIHPLQRRTLEETLPALKLEFPTLGHVELVDDATISPGGCRVFAGNGMVDAELEEQLDRVAAELLPEPQEDDPEVYALTRVKKPRVKKTEDRR